MRAIVLALLVIAASFAGCVNDSDDVAPAATTTKPPAATNKTVQVVDKLNNTFTNVVTGPAAAADLNATLDTAPELKIGEWWRIRFESPLTGANIEFVRVIADRAEDGGYVVGMPHEGWFKEAVIYHTPGFGDVNADLSFLTHNKLFQPVKFPLTADQTWETEFSGGAMMTATVEPNVAEKTATITFTAPNNGILGTGVNSGPANTVLTVVYDAKIHEVREFRHAIAKFEVVEHGYDYAGWVTVPRGEDLVFFHGRIGPALDLGLQPAAPLETLQVAGGFNRVSFIQVAQSIGTEGAGVYHIKSTSPDGTEYLTQSLPGGEGQIQFFENSAPDGDWNLEYASGGPGIVFIEGIAYHQYDIHLPEGHLRSDHAHAVVR